MRGEGYEENGDEWKYVRTIVMRFSKGKQTLNGIWELIYMDLYMASNNLTTVTNFDEVCILNQEKYKALNILICFYPYDFSGV